MHQAHALTFVLFLSGAAASGQTALTAAVDATMQQYEARAVEVEGKVSRTREAMPWLLAPGESVPVSQLLKTGRDGYARFTVAGGSEFSLFSNSSVLFRRNNASAGDLLDVISGRVRVKLEPTAGLSQQRVFTSIAIISTSHPALISLAIDEDQNVRLDVLEGEVRVQHRLLPRNEPTVVRAIDAILIQRDEQLTRRVDRGNLYRYTVKPLRDLWTAMTPTRGHSDEPIEGNKFLASDVRLSF